MPDSPNRANAPIPSLAARVEALLRDPRGQFRPRPVVLCVAQDLSAEQVVMQVGEDELGRVRLLSAVPLADGVVYALYAISAASHGATQTYVLDSTREGVRPEDAGVHCWINTLSPVRVTPPSPPHD